MSDEQLADAETSNSSPIPVVSEPKSNRRLLFLVCLLAVMSLAGLGYGYFFVKAQVDKTTLLQQSLSDLETKLNENIVAATELNDKSTNQQEVSQQLQTNLNGLSEQLSAQKKQLQQLAEIDRSDWQLAEAEYLLQLANQRLLLMHDVTGVAELLNSVDQILASVDDASLHAVRKKLAEELVAVRASSAIDREGIYVRIAAVAKQAETLPIVLPKSNVFEAADKEDKKSEISSPSWINNLFDGLNRALAKLGSYVRINHRDSPLPATLAPEQEGLVRRSVQLQFDQAQFALLASQQSLYEMSLRKAREWLFDLYLADRESTHAVIKEIDELLALSVTQNLPKIGESYQLLKSYIENRHLRKKPQLENQFAPNEASL